MQVQFARKVKQSLWHNSKHFAYWCRYGSRQQDIRRRQVNYSLEWMRQVKLKPFFLPNLQMSECVKWGSVGMNAGILLLMNKQKSHSTSKWCRWWKSHRKQRCQVKSVRYLTDKTKNWKVSKFAQLYYMTVNISCITI